MDVGCGESLSLSRRSITSFSPLSRRDELDRCYTFSPLDPLLHCPHGTTTVLAFLEVLYDYGSPVC